MACLEEDELMFEASDGVAGAPSVMADGQRECEAARTWQAEPSP